MTTDIKGRLSAMGKQFKEKLTKNGAAEGAELALPVDSVVRNAASAVPQKRVTAQEIAAALSAFGWKVSGNAGEALPLSPEVRENLITGRAETAPAALRKSASEGARHTDAKELFRGLNQDILKEVFTEEELAELEGDRTQVFSRPKAEELPQEKAAPAPEERKRQPRPAARRAEKPAMPAGQARPAARAAEIPAEEYEERDFRPVRRRRSYRTGLRGGLMYFGFVVCVSVILASFAWLAADDVLSLNKDYAEAEIYVGSDVEISQVSSELYSKGLIRYRRLFTIFAHLMKAEKKIDPGVYTLSTRLDYNAMIHAMHQSSSGIEERATVTVTIPEGKTLKQTFQILAERGVCPYESLLECAADHDFGYAFLEELPYGSETRLEGYLFPDTYEFFAPSDPEEAIGKFLSNFKSKFSLDMQEQALSMGYSTRDILTIASLIEMEAGSDLERATIASVIYNRLNSSYYPFLQIDATIQYALEERKESLTSEDLQIDSPYNTYKYEGLPPGPIANPGLASIRAALDPEETGYYFYALNTNGVHSFFATQDQFQYFINSSEFGG